MARHPSSNPQPRGGNEDPPSPLSHPTSPSAPAGLIIYQSPDGTSRIHVRLDQETLWLSQRQLAELFQKSVPTINEHIQGIFVEGELPPEATIRKY